VTDRTYLSLLPTDVVFCFRVLGDSMEGSSATPSWASDTVPLTDRLVQESTMISQGFNSSIEQKSKAKAVKCTLESVCASGTTSGSGGLLS